MESLAVAVTIILIVVFSSGFIAFATSWSRNRVAGYVSRALGILAIFTGAWLGFTLSDGNGFFVGSIPVSLGLFAIWNSRHRSRVTLVLPKS